MNRPTDDLDDLTLPQRPRRPDPRDDYRPDPRMSGRASAREELLDDTGSPEREFTLSTGTVLALFFGLALICAVFFGFGYSMGRKSAASTASTAAITDSGTSSGDADGVATGSAAAVAKPSAAAPAIAIPAYQGDTSGRASAKTGTAAGTTSVTVPLDSATPAKSKKPVPGVPTGDPDGQIVEAKPAGVRLSTGSVVVPAAAGNAAASAPMPVAGVGSTYVQIAAVSHKEDADVLLSALRRRGYTVFTRQGDTDKLIHVQVGPYATKKDAEVMRQRLLGDGYNAILK